jgi:hypothetical protein
VLLPLLVGAGLLLATLLSYGLAAAVIVQVMVPLSRRGPAGWGFWKDVGVMMAVTLITGAAHLAAIALWAVAFLACGVIPAFEAAFYLSAENYTALGYGDVVPPGRWRLLGPLEAINGLLLFGLSTSLMFAVMSRLITNHLRHRHGRRPGAPGDKHG